MAKKNFVDAKKAVSDEEVKDREKLLKEAERFIKGVNRMHFEGLGDAWAVVTGMHPSAAIPQVVGTVLHEGLTRPAWQWQRQGNDYMLLAWPKDQPIRASVLLMGEKDKQLKPVDCVPLLEGLVNDLTISSVYPWQNGKGADVAADMLEGHNPMWFYDPLYLRDKDDLTEGITQTFLLSALALGFRKALLDEITITNGPRFLEHGKKWLEENPDKTTADIPPLKIPVAGKYLIMPGQRFCEYQMRGIIEDVEDAMLEKMEFKVCYMNFPFENREPMRLPVYVSKSVLGDLEPKKGMEIDAYVWLQGRVIDFDQQGEA